MISEPGKPPIVYQGRAMPGDIAAAPGLPMGDGRSGAEVMADAWGAVLHQQAPGLPGVHHTPAPR